MAVRCLNIPYVENKDVPIFISADFDNIMFRLVSYLQYRKFEMSNIKKIKYIYPLFFNLEEIKKIYDIVVSGDLSDFDMSIFLDVSMVVVLKSLISDYVVTGDVDI